MSGNPGTAADMEEELRLMEKFLVRLRKSFLLEKEDALAEGSEALQLFRNRTRSHYSPSVSRMNSNLRQLRYRITKVENVSSSIFLRLEALEKAIKEARAHFSGTPNRLLRFAGQNTGDD
ncbi:MAG: hypothetical protein U9P42_02840 [Candidatus Fermentibacteria bacterium]|nr:hypothetical protein [Candidatus Fermentibacteria bacterium]